MEAIKALLELTKQRLYGDNDHLKQLLGSIVDKVEELVNAGPKQITQEGAAMMEKFEAGFKGFVESMQRMLITAQKDIATLSSELESVKEINAGLVADLENVKQVIAAHKNGNAGSTTTGNAQTVAINQSDAPGT